MSQLRITVIRSKLFDQSSVNRSPLRVFEETATVVAFFLFFFFYSLSNRVSHSRDTGNRQM